VIRRQLSRRTGVINWFRIDASTDSDTVARKAGSVLGQRLPYEAIREPVGS
jgi:hypothetical protein